MHERVNLNLIVAVNLRERPFSKCLKRQFAIIANWWHKILNNRLLSETSRCGYV